MSDIPRAQSLTELAEAAAAAGDWVSAARHLRNLSGMQEAELGPEHPDLANTLNNLAVVSERAGDLDAAEAAFRRSCAIAHAAFEADHPFVATSDRNLREFCEANGRPLNKVDKSEEVEEFEKVEKLAPNAPSGVPGTAAPVPVTGRSWSTLVIVGAVGGLTAAAALMWFTTTRRSETTPAVAPAPVTVTAPAKRDETKPEATTGPTLVPKPAPAPVAVPIAETASSPITLVSATVCRDFSTAGSGAWRCTPVADSAPAGPFVFYTRVRTPQPTTIEHRWYRGDALHQRVNLRIAANTGEGYRTFSRNTVGSERAGTWRVELRDAAGAVLHEQTFVVQ